MIDIEALVGTWLRDNGLRAVSKTPTDTSDGWIRHTLISAPQDPDSQALWLVSYLLQFDVYSSESGEEGSQIREASGQSQLVSLLLVQMSESEHEQGVVTACRIVTAGRAPDTTFEKARERYIIQARVWAHPHREGS